MAEISHLSTRCPECGDKVSMPAVTDVQLAARKVRYRGFNPMDLYAVLHLCPNEDCFGATIAYYRPGNQVFERIFHHPQYLAHTVGDAVPPRPRKLLQDANDARNASTACAQASIKAVEAMLAHLGIVEPRSLKGRIRKAVSGNILPQIMADWAEEIRVIANDAHTDSIVDADPLPDTNEAGRALKFANTLAEYLFVLPSEIQKARPEKPPEQSA